MWSLIDNRHFAQFESAGGGWVGSAVSGSVGLSQSPRRDTTPMSKFAKSAMSAVLAVICIITQRSSCATGRELEDGSHVEALVTLHGDGLSLSTAGSTVRS